MRFSLIRVVPVVALLAGIGAAAGGPAEAAQRAAIVMDMRDGTVYYADDADRRQQPASLTKMMTLYLTFEAVEDGRIGLDQRFTVSRHASHQPASKLYLKQGQRVRVRDLIRAAAIKSANDAAMVLAEGIGGSQAAFATMMNRKARQLGMTNTTYVNPHGLTAKGHLTTARDQAILARHLFYDYPEYFNIFSRKSAVAAGKRIHTTNRLLSTYPGMEGIKTGYTRAAGFNLAGYAHRGSEEILAIVMGAKSSAGRNSKVAELLDLGFSKAPSHVRVARPGFASRTMVASAPLPAAKPATSSSGFEALARMLVPTAAAATPPATAPVSQSPYAPASIAGLPLPRGGAGADALIATGSEPGTPMPRPRPGSDTTAWAADIGPYSSETTALAMLAAIRDQQLAEVDSFRVSRVGDGSDGPVYNLHLAGLSGGAAAELCGALSASDAGCSAVPETR